MPIFNIYPLNIIRKYECDKVIEMRKLIANEFKALPENIIIFDSKGTKILDANTLHKNEEYHGGVIPIRCFNHAMKSKK